MDLPRKITQVGEPDKEFKIYIEDYVYSYLKQTNRNFGVKGVGLALYGRREQADNKVYIFIYGAAVIESINGVPREFDMENNQEIEARRKEFFPQYQCQGYKLLLGDTIEGFYILKNQLLDYVSGYMVFYENNDNMLNYMISTKRKTLEPEKEFIKEESQAPFLKKMDLKEKDDKPVHRGNNRGMGAVCFIALLAIMAYILQENGKMVEVENKVRDYFASQDGESAHNEIIAREDLTKAIEKENNEQVIYEEVQSENVIAENSEDAFDQEILPEVGEEIEPETPEQVEEFVMPEPVVAEPVQIAAAEPEKYEIQKGDTLLGICNRIYGDASRIRELCELNGISNPDDIKIGQKILIP